MLCLEFIWPDFVSVYSAVNEYQHCWEGNNNNESIYKAPYIRVINSLVYRINDTIRIVDTLIRYMIRIAIRIVSFIKFKYCGDRN